MMRWKWIGLGAWVGVLSWLGGSQAQTLTLEEYLRQVRSDHPGMKAAQAAAESAEHLLQERRLLTTPYAFAEGAHAYDRSQSLQPMYYGDSRRQNQLTLGVEEQTLLGMRWRIFHQTQYTGIDGADPNYVPFENYYTCKSGLELSQDLWQNAWGRNLQSLSGALEAKYQAELWGRRYQMRQIQVQSEIVYWKLALARDVVRIQAELLERAERLTAWVEERVRMKLQDRSDFMQAQSQVEARRLELEGARDQARMAAEAFNLLRAQTSGGVEEELAMPLVEPSSFPTLTEKIPPRLDVRAGEMAMQAAVWDSVRKQDDLQPQVQARAAVYLNGLDRDLSPALADSRNWDYRAYSVGINVRVPLDWFTRAEIDAGYTREGEAAKQQLSRSRSEAESEWRELRRRLPEFQARLKIAHTLEELQKQKAEYERQRLRRGNSLTYQVLQFEQDWGQSQLARVAIENNILELLAQVKLYGE
jgi:outer membrane protein TolC